MEGQGEGVVVYGCFQGITAKVMRRFPGISEHPLP